jgi:hypothetical protein
MNLDFSATIPQIPFIFDFSVFLHFFQRFVELRCQIAVFAERNRGTRFVSDSEVQQSAERNGEKRRNRKTEEKMVHQREIKEFLM